MVHNFYRIFEIFFRQYIKDLFNPADLYCGFLPILIYSKSCRFRLKYKSKTKTTEIYVHQSSK